MQSHLQEQHSSGNGIAPGECVKALEVLTNTLVRQLGLELIEGYKVMVSQAREIVASTKGDEDDLVKTLLIALESVPNWSQTLILEETQRIVQKRPSLPSINAANTVAGTQVLFSIRPFDFSDERGAFDLKAPDLSVVIHHAYMYLAEILSMHIESNGPEVDRRVLREMCFDSVREAIDQTIPVNDVIQYLLPDVAQLVAQMNRQFNNAALARPPIEPVVARTDMLSTIPAAVSPAMYQAPPSVEQRVVGNERVDDREGDLSSLRSKSVDDDDDDDDQHESASSAASGDIAGTADGRDDAVEYDKTGRATSDDDDTQSSRLARRLHHGGGHSPYGERSRDVVMRASSSKKDRSFL